MKKIIGLIFVLIISYWMVRPLLTTGYFPMHDDTQIARVVEMGRALREGQFPVRWVSDLGYGYGYPIFNFYGPLPYYVGGFFYALGLTGLTATKIMMGFGLILAGIAMYLTVSDIIGITGGILSAAFYMYAPYHAVDAYVRGAVGEYYALIFFPLIFWGFWRKNILVGALGIAGLVISHTILGYSGMVFVGFAAIILIIRHARLSEWKSVKTFVVMILLGLGLSAFFWLPAITEMKYTNVASQISASADYHDHFVCLPQLWNSAWGFGGSAKGCLDGFSFKIGKEHLIIAMVALLAILAGFIKERRAKKFILVGLGIFLLSIFFMLSLSQHVWGILPLFAYVQYPWRFLAIAVFGISLMVGGITFLFRQVYLRWSVVVISIGVLLFVEVKRFVPQYLYNRPEAEFETVTDIRFRVSKISDEYLPSAIVRPTKESEVPSDTIVKPDALKMEINEETDTYNKFSFHSGQENKVRINIAYFPGWHYIVNITDVTPEVINGLPVITVPVGDTVIQMMFRNTPVRTLGNILSIISLGVCLTLYDRKNKKTVS